MSVSIKNAVFRAGFFLPCLLLCMAPTAIVADETVVRSSIPGVATLRMTTNSHEADDAFAVPFPVVSDNSAGLNFDLGGSDTRKLQLQLNQPLTFSAGTRARVLENGANMLGLDATLDVPLSNHFGLSAGVDRQVGTAHFQSLGSIQCMNGTLRADSYTASGCRFVNEPLASSEQQRFNLGTDMDFGKASASFDWFTQDSAFNQSRARNQGAIGGQAVMGNSLISPNLGNPLLSSGGSDSLQFMNSETSGINLNFKVGISTDTKGDIRVGLAFTRILDANYQGLYTTNSGDPLSWTLAEPFNSASMNLEWNRGAFSSGVQAFYREPVNFLNRDSLDATTTFDVHFTWRTPWNANLSVGASNVLNSGIDTPGNTENPPVDPFESIYGRIPYVRYKQDL
jgi:hypothetical protein